MATPRVLGRPPIAEALVDLRSKIEQPFEAFQAFMDELKASEGFQDVQIRRDIRAVLNVKDGRLLPPSTEMSGFQGLRATNLDGSLIVQLRPNGFTLNNLKTYMGGDRLISESLRLWTRFAERMNPQPVTRVAFRYINRLELPLRSGDLFTRYLKSPPSLPDGAPQNVSEFLSRVVGHDLPTESTVIVTQRLKQLKEDANPVVIIDVDVFRIGEFAIQSEALRPVMDSLRLLRNRSFFSLLTDDAVSLYA